MNDSAEVKKEQIKEQAGEGNVKAYDIMRVLLTVVIVADHALYLSMTYGFGGVDYASPECLGNCLGTDVCQIMMKMTVFVLFFQMPAFFFLSGGVFRIGIKWERYPDLGSVIENKFKRLVLPALAAGIFWMVPLKFLGNGYPSARVLPAAVFKGVVLCQGGLGHLWYCFTLFWIFVAAYACLKYFVKGKWYFFLAVIFLLGTFYGILEIGLPGAVLLPYYMQFFLAGYCFEYFRKNIMNHVCISMAVAAAVAAVSYHFTASAVTTGMFWQDWLKTLGINACAVVLFLLCHLLEKTGITRLWLYRELERDSFHIYLLHDPVNYVILAVFAAVTQKLGTVRPINWNAAGMVLVLLRIFGTIGVCVAASAVLRRIKPVKTGWLLAAVCIFSMICVFCFG